MEAIETKRTFALRISLTEANWILSESSVCVYVYHCNGTNKQTNKIYLTWISIIITIKLNTGMLLHFPFVRSFIVAVALAYLFSIGKC